MIKLINIVGCYFDMLNPDSDGNWSNCDWRVEYFSNENSHPPVGRCESPM